MSTPASTTTPARPTAAPAAVSSPAPHRLRLSGLGADQRGGVAIFVAIMMFATAGIAALAVDIGAISSDKRSLNKLTDIVAIDVARWLENGPEADDADENTRVQAVRSARTNGFEPSEGRNHSLTVELGLWTHQTGFHPCIRQADAVTSQPLYVDGCRANATRVTISDHSERVFAYWTEGRRLDRITVAVHPYGGTPEPPCVPGEPGCIYRECEPDDPTCEEPPDVCEVQPCEPPPDPSTTTTSTTAPTTTTTMPETCLPPDPDCPTETLFSGAGVGLGSFAARADSTQFAIYNAVLSELLNPHNDASAPALALTAVGYDGLANAAVTVDDIAAAMGFGSPRQLLEASVSVRNLFDAMATAFAASGDPNQVAAAAPLAQVALSTAAALSYSVGDLLEVEAGHAGAVGTASLDLLDLVVASAQVANTDNLLTTSMAIPTGLANLGVILINLEMSVIEAPRFVFGPAEHLNGEWVTSVTNAQVQFNYALRVSTAPILANFTTSYVHLPIYVDAFRADADLTRVRCDPDRVAAVDPVAGDEVDVFAEVSSLNAAVGRLTAAVTADVSFPADIAVGTIGRTNGVLSPQINVGARHTVTVSGTSDTLTFVPPYDADNTQSIHGPDPTATDPVPVGSTLLNGLTFIDQATGNPVPPDLSLLLHQNLDPVLVQMDSYIELVANGVGLTVGGADVTVNGIDCLSNDPIIVSHD